jgi:sensor histidine kinase YesM
MKFRKLYFNFWYRNIALYLLIVILLIAGTLLNPNSQFDYESQGLKILKCPIRLLIIFVLIGAQNKILYEHYLRNKKYLLFVSGLIILVRIFYSINLYSPFSINPIGGISSLISTIFIYVLGLGFYFVHKNILEVNIFSRQKLLGKEEEIRYLRAQLNPHFLFNALNNL